MGLSDGSEQAHLLGILEWVCALKIGGVLLGGPYASNTQLTEWCV